MQHRALFEGYLTSAHSVRLKTLVMYNTLKSVKKDIESSVAKHNAEARRDGVATWEAVKQLVGLPNPDPIQPNELVFLAKAGEYDLLHDLILLNVKYQSVVGALTAYNSERAELRNMPHSDSNDLLLFLARGNALTTSLAELISSLNEDTPFAKSAHDRIAPAAQRYFGSESFPIVTAI